MRGYKVQLENMFTRSRRPDPHGLNGSPYLQVKHCNDGSHWKMIEPYAG